MRRRPAPGGLDHVGHSLQDAAREHAPVDHVHGPAGGPDGDERARGWRLATGWQMPHCAHMWAPDLHTTVSDGWHRCSGTMAGWHPAQGVAIDVHIRQRSRLCWPAAHRIMTGWQMWYCAMMGGRMGRVGGAGAHFLCVPGRESAI